MDLQVTETFNKTSIVYYDDRYRQIVSMGGSRSSKSYSILQILMLEMVSKMRLKITVWRDTKVTCRATVLEDFKKIIMFDDFIYSGFKENKSKGEFTYLPTGSRIIFEGADDIGKVLGSSQDISFFNEVTEFSKDVYLQITQRTSGKVICDYNPSKDFWLESYRLDDRTAFIHSDFRDNAFCPPNIIDQLLSYEPWESGTYEIVGSNVHYNGKPITRDNEPPPNEYNVKRGTANTYMWLVYGLGLGSEKPNRIYSSWRKITQEEFDALPYTSYYGLDFGIKNPTALVEVKYDGDGAFFICPRFYKPLTDISDSLPSILRNISRDITSGKSIVVADSAKQSYIDRLVEEGISAIGAIKGGGSVTSGINDIQSVVIYYVATPEFENEYTNYSWLVDRYNKPTDEPEKKYDHYMDAVRYVITYLITWLGIRL